MDVGADDGDLARPDDVGAARAADIVPVHDQRLQHDREGERGDREERAAQAQREIAGAEPDDAGDDAADHDQDGDRQRKDRMQRFRDRAGEVAVDHVGELVEGDRRVGTHGEERGRAEVHVAGIAAEDVPGGRQHDELQHGVAGEEDVVVTDEARREEHRRRHCDRDQKKDSGLHDRRSYRPSRPAGRNASVSRSTPNATAGAHEGP